MENINLNNLNLQELDNSALGEVNGGDKFMSDLGYVLGYAWEGFLDMMNTPIDYQYAAL